MRDTSGQARECHPENLVGYSFIIKGRWGGGEDHLLPRSLSLPSLTPSTHWEGEFLTLYVPVMVLWK